ncbi:MAG: hypothetical protein QXP70_03870, partial [Methanomassiliicoccales archaeon]
GLADISLLLTTDKKVIPNELDATNAGLIVVTGANSGGKSTFLRSIGQAQIMMQLGLFVAAESYVSAIAGNIFTHFKRREDTSLSAGKLEDELIRMKGIIENCEQHDMILLNESFSSTNAMEASEIAGDIVKALVDSDVRVAYVTHLFELAEFFKNTYGGKAKFLVAERKESGERTFRIIEGYPARSVFARDIYSKVFGGNNEVSQKNVQPAI